MQIPFLNRKRYIEVKAFTNVSGVHTRAPLSLNFGYDVKQKVSAGFLSRYTDYSTCYARIKSAKHSITIPAPAEIRLQVDEHTIQDQIGGSTRTAKVDYVHNTDEAYGFDRDFHVTKIFLPWTVEEKSGVKFVMARHLGNMTSMNVLSGVLDFRTNSEINVFNILPKFNFQQTIPFLTPMAALYPLSDLPIQLECAYSPQDYQRIVEQNYHPRFRGDALREK